MDRDIVNAFISRAIAKMGSIRIQNRQLFYLLRRNKKKKSVAQVCWTNLHKHTASFFF